MESILNHLHWDFHYGSLMAIAFISFTPFLPSIIVCAQSKVYKWVPFTSLHLAYRHYYSLFSSPVWTWSSQLIFLLTQYYFSLFFFVLSEFQVLWSGDSHLVKTCDSSRLSPADLRTLDRRRRISNVKENVLGDKTVNEYFGEGGGDSFISYHVFWGSGNDILGSERCFVFVCG